MGSFDKIKSGLEGLDKVLQNIRIGDNVVWQISALEEYRYVAAKFMQQALREDRKIIYIRFAEHDPILEQTDRIKVIWLDSEQGFEGFTVKVHEIITQEGKEAFYVFDSLSELQAVWATDLMMSNFFQVTCPYLFEMDTVAYFALLRNRHSYYSIAKIRETTQLFLDLYSKDQEYFVHPLKVFNRYSTTMFLPHVFKDGGGRLEALTDGVSASKFYNMLSHEQEEQTEKVLDNWDSFFIRMKLAVAEGLLDKKKIIPKLCRMVIGKDEKIIELVKKEFTLKDFFRIKERMIGTGAIGGKTVGMLLARKMIHNHLPSLIEHMEPHDSFYIGADVFYTFIVQNGWWKLRIAQRTPQGYFKAAKALKAKILEGHFEEGIREQFRRMLEYYGQNPIIIRSSSLLEDGFGNAFAGKYESIFCANIGSLEERLTAFEKALKQVYASAMDESALVYRKQRGMSEQDEQMAILVQRVSGSRFEDIFMPCAGGVGHSHNAYVWHKGIDPREGMIRIVLGLGTRAVDRADGDYPRVASLDKPQMTTLTTQDEKYKFSQKYIDIIDITEGRLATIDIRTLTQKVPRWFKDTLLENDYEAQLRLREIGKREEIFAITCDKLLENKQLTSDLKSIMKTLEKCYHYPVDIEFTINLSQSGAYVINLLQCRPLQVKGKAKFISLPTIDLSKTLFKLTHFTMGGPLFQKIDQVVMIDASKYYYAPLHIKYSVARAIGTINTWAKEHQQKIMLIGPGRWGTSSPEQGVPITFAEISYIRVLCEVPYEGLEIMPELSYGSHFFQDLVETDIFYAALISSQSDNFYQPQLLENQPNRYDDIIPERLELADIMKIYDVTNINLTLISEIITHQTVCMSL